MWDPAALWRQTLQKGGYEHECRNRRQFRQLRKLPRIWRVVARATGLRRGARIFEVGCGGAIHLVRLALNGFDVAGIDVSPEVIRRATNFINDVRRFDPSVGSIKLVVGDFMKLDCQDVPLRQDHYDLVFNVGVIEHYLEADHRIVFLKRKATLARRGGAVVSIVPAGFHPYRAEQRQRKWGGYDIPEVDYSPDMLASEMKRAGLGRVCVIPHNVAGYLLARPAEGWWQLVNRLGYLALQGLTPVLPESFKWRHAYSYVAIGWKM